jgi:hypothetical protein
MPVEPFVDSPEPRDPQAPLWRYIEFWKFKDLVESGELYMRRADRLNDEHEGLPAAEYERVLNLNWLQSTRARIGEHCSGARRHENCFGCGHVVWLPVCPGRGNSMGTDRRRCKQNPENG